MRVEVSFQGIAKSEALEGRILEKAAKLEQLHDDVAHCRVVVSSPHRHQHSGSLFEVHIDAHYPGGEASVSRSHRNDGAHADPAVAVRDAFAALHQRLTHVKAH